MSEYIQQAEDLLIKSIKLAKKKKYNVTRKDGFRINITNIRNGKSRNNPLTSEQLKLLEKLYYDRWTYKQIMQVMKISRSKVARSIQKIHNYKWKPTKKQIKKDEKSIVRLRKQGRTYVEIRRKLNVPSTLISLVLKRNNMLGQYRKY